MLDWLKKDCARFGKAFDKFARIEHVDLNDLNLIPGKIEQIEIGVVEERKIAAIESIAGSLKSIANHLSNISEHMLRKR